MNGRGTVVTLAGRCLVALAAACSVAGCASVRHTVGGWFGETPPPSPAAAADAARPGGYYAAVDGLSVYAEPSASAKVVGHLTLHEPVTRSRVEHGYAYVAADQNRVVGWVDNAQLLWRLPAAGGSAAPAAEPEAPAAPSTGGAASETAASAPAAEGTPTPTQTPSAVPTAETAAAPSAPAAPPPTVQAAAPTPQGKASAPRPAVFDPF